MCVCDLEPIRPNREVTSGIQKPVTDASSNTYSKKKLPNIYINIYILPFYYYYIFACFYIYCRQSTKNSTRMYVNKNVRKKY